MIVKQYFDSGKSVFNNVDLEELYGGLVESIETFNEVLTYKESLETHNSKFHYRHLGLEGSINKRLKSIKRTFGLEEDKAEEDKKDKEKSNDGIMGTLKSIGNKIMEVIKDIWNHILNLFGAGTDKKVEETKKDLAAVSEAVKKADNKLVIPADELIKKLYVIWVAEDTTLNEIITLADISKQYGNAAKTVFDNINKISTSDTEGSEDNLRIAIAPFTEIITNNKSKLEVYKDTEEKDDHNVTVYKLALTYNNILTLTVNEPAKEFDDEENKKHNDKQVPTLGSESNSDLIKEKWEEAFSDSKELNHEGLTKLLDALTKAHNEIGKDVREAAAKLTSIKLDQDVNKVVTAINAKLDKSDKKDGELVKANNAEIRAGLNLIKSTATLTIKLASSLINVMKNNHIDKLIGDLGQHDALKKLVEKQKTYKESVPKQKPEEQGGDGSNVTV